MLDMGTGAAVHTCCMPYEKPKDSKNHERHGTQPEGQEQARPETRAASEQSQDAGELETLKGPSRPIPRLFGGLDPNSAEFAERIREILCDRLSTIPGEVLVRSGSPGWLDTILEEVLDAFQYTHRLEELIVEQLSIAQSDAPPVLCDHPNYCRV